MGKKKETETKRKKDLRISFGIQDLLSFHNNTRKFGLPFWITSSFRAVNFSCKSGQTHGRYYSKIKKIKFWNKTIEIEDDPVTSKCFELLSLSWVDAFHYAKPF